MIDLDTDKKRKVELKKASKDAKREGRFYIGKTLMEKIHERRKKKKKNKKNQSIVLLIIVTTLPFLLPFYGGPSLDYRPSSQSESKFEKVIEHDNILDATHALGEQILEEHDVENSTEEHGSVFDDRTSLQHVDKMNEIKGLMFNQ